MKFKRDKNELELRYLAQDEDIDTLNPWSDYHKLPIVETCTWQIKSDLNIEVKDKDGKIKYQGKSANSQIVKINTYY